MARNRNSTVPIAPNRSVASISMTSSPWGDPLTAEEPRCPVRADPHEVEFLVAGQPADGVVRRLDPPDVGHPRQRPLRVDLSYLFLPLPSVRHLSFSAAAV